MLRLYMWLKTLVSRERGQDMVEYALITGIMAVVILAILFVLLHDALADWVAFIADAIIPGGTPGTPVV